MSEQTPEPPDELAAMHALGVRMMRAGWATAVGHGPQGMAIEWTEEGAMAMELLWSLYRNLGPAELTATDLDALWLLLKVEAGRRGWDRDEPPADR